MSKPESRQTTVELAAGAIAVGLGAVSGRLAGRRQLRRQLSGGKDVPQPTAERHLWRSRASAAVAVGAMAAAGQRGHVSTRNAASHFGMARLYDAAFLQEVKEMYAKAYPDSGPLPVGPMFKRMSAHLAARPEERDEFHGKFTHYVNAIDGQRDSGKDQGNRAKAWFATGLTAGFVAGHQTAKAHVVAKEMRRATKQSRGATD